MDTGPFFFGEPPDDLGGLGFGADPDALQRGWLPPEDRLWRHPSEIQGSGPRPVSDDQASSDTPRRGRSGNRWMGAAAGVVGAAAVASVAVAVTRGPSTTSSAPRAIAASDTALTTAPAASGSSASRPVTIVGPDVMKMVDTMRASLVSLSAQAGSSVAGRVTGVVLPGGSLVVTAAASVGSATSFDVVTVDGRRHNGKLVGVDARSGVAVVSVQDHLQPASFGDNDVSADQLAVAACVCGGGASSAGTADVAIGMVRAVGTTATLDGGPSLVNAIEAEMPLGPSSWGSVLLDDHGQVIGILDGERSTGDDVFGYFVPTSLALGVADELATSHHVAKGWLGVVCTDAPGGGAEVTTVLPGSPAATAGLHPGDVVEAVDTRGVASLADLQALLYTSLPGTKLQLTVLRNGSVSTTPVVVRASPS